jgi:hypothetical protein
MDGQTLAGATRARPADAGTSIDKAASDAQVHRTAKGYGFPSGGVSPEQARALSKPKGLPVTVVRGRDSPVLRAEAGPMLPEAIEQLARFF